MAINLSPGVRILPDPTLEYVVPAYGEAGHPYWEQRTMATQEYKMPPTIKIVEGNGPSLGMAILNFNNQMNAYPGTFDVELLSDINIKTIGSEEQRNAVYYVFQQVRITARQRE